MKKPAKKATPKKATKKPAVKASAKKKNTKKTKGPGAVAASPKMFRVEMEHPSHTATETTYSYIPCAGRDRVEEALAKNAMLELKEMGVGGRLVLLEDKGKETVTETWGSVDRAASAETTEKEALEKGRVGTC